MRCDFAQRRWENEPGSAIDVQHPAAVVLALDHFTLGNGLAGVLSHGADLLSVGQHDPWFGLRFGRSNDVWACSVTDGQHQSIVTINGENPAFSLLP